MILAREPWAVEGPTTVLRNGPQGGLKGARGNVGMGRVLMADGKTSKRWAPFLPSQSTPTRVKLFLDFATMIPVHMERLEPILVNEVLEDREVDMPGMYLIIEKDRQNQKISFTARLYYLGK